MIFFVNYCIVGFMAFLLMIFLASRDVKIFGEDIHEFGAFMVAVFWPLFLFFLSAAWVLIMVKRLKTR